MLVWSLWLIDWLICWLAGWWVDMFIVRLINLVGSFVGWHHLNSYEGIDLVPPFIYASTEVIVIRLRGRSMSLPLEANTWVTEVTHFEVWVGTGRWNLFVPPADICYPKDESCFVTTQCCFCYHKQQHRACVVESADVEKGACINAQEEDRRRVL